MTAFFPTNRSHGSLHLQSAGGLLPYTPTDGPITAFDRTVLPLHARTDYLLAYAFCAFQRFTMIHLSNILIEYSDKAIRAPHAEPGALRTTKGRWSAKGHDRTRTKAT